MFGASYDRTSAAFDDGEVHALQRLYALATAEAERVFHLDSGAQRRLANMVVFTYRSAILNDATTTSEQEQQLLQDCLRRFAPLQNAVSKAIRRRSL